MQRTAMKDDPADRGEAWFEFEKMACGAKRRWDPNRLPPVIIDAVTFSVPQAELDKAIQEYTAAMDNGLSFVWRDMIEDPIM